MKNQTTLDNSSIRVIKIGKEALFEFIYEKFIENQEQYFDVDPLEVIDTFDLDFENGEFIFCVHKDEDKDGKEYSKEELVELSK